MPTEDLPTPSETIESLPDVAGPLAILALAAIGGVQVTRWGISGTKKVTAKIKERKETKAQAKTAAS